jgi:hypothetical protein
MGEVDSFVDDASQTKQTVRLLRDFLLLTDSVRVEKQ